MKFNLKEIEIKTQLSRYLTVFYTRSAESFQLPNTVLIFKMRSLASEKSDRKDFSTLPSKENKKTESIASE